MTTITKHLRNMKAEGKPTKMNKTERVINKMTNWQNSQWLRDGAKVDTVELFTKLMKNEQSPQK